MDGPPFAMPLLVVGSIFGDDNGADEGSDEAEDVAPLLAAVFMLVVDAVQRLLLYVDLLSCRTEFIHTFPRLIRNIVQGLFRLGEDFVCAGSCRGGQFFYL